MQPKLTLVQLVGMFENKHILMCLGNQIVGVTPLSDKTLNFFMDGATPH